MKRVVIKVGSHVLSDDGSINQNRIDNLCKFISDLSDKFDVILVSSGAISAGQAKFNLPRTSVVNKQILSSLGQPYLMEIYSKTLSKYNKLAAQILLTAGDFDSRKITNHAKNVINGLLENKILPIINENDATGISEIVYGDNDRLSSAVAYYFDADLLVILSDIDGYYDSDPRENKNAKIRPLVTSLSDEELNKTSDTGSKHGTGGITTKLLAAKFLMDNKKDMFLASGFDLSDARAFLLDNNQIGGTIFKGKQ
ncbi:glutamate 5-kinase [Campylobacter hyointestinalis]|uniref:Glutamate 5-kinase n=3 Tax=Campylobacter hyointestinalis TaxID=198 RepID=A0AAV6EED4_CAMHY|nr:glutamate 5-kinase [Campylobacter hyointestinalis]KAB0612419.1 glutamate 5-kinase [Campylobacter hyointestinalis subsp. lawsonii]QKF68870.1 gamma-glutamyl kinase [Campylobacter hyointestinalis subsp. lawsonii]